MYWNELLLWLQKNLRPIIELLYFISGIGLIFTIVIGLKQIRIIKTDNDNRDKRIAVEKSIEYIDRYAKNILPKSKMYQEKLISGELAQFNGEKDPDFLFKANYSKEELDIVRKKDAGAFEMANELEIISTAIVSGLASKDTVFTAMGRVYCETVESLYDIICYSRDIGNIELFKNTISLYREWRPKFKDVSTPIG